MCEKEREQSEREKMLMNQGVWVNINTFVPCYQYSFKINHWKKIKRKKPATKTTPLFIGAMLKTYASDLTTLIFSPLLIIFQWQKHWSLDRLQPSHLLVLMRLPVSQYLPLTTHSFTETLISWLFQKNLFKE